MSTNPPPLMIVGAGIAGYTLAKLWRQLETETPLVIVCEDDGDFYHKPLLSVALARGKTPDATISESKDDLAASLNATILTHTTAHGIDVDKKQLLTNRGNLEYGQLVIATGAQPKKLDHLKGAFTLNHLDDYRQLRPLIETAKSINIVGAGLVGCELANDVLNLDKTVRLISNTALPLNGLVPEPIGQALKQGMIDAGITWHEHNPPEADLTIQAIGLQHKAPISDALALEHGGIVVNAYGQTNLKDIYALGDCAQVHGVTLRYIGPIRHQAQAIAQTLTGNPTPIVYPALPVSAKTPTYPIVVCRHPWVNGHWKVIQDNDGIQMEQFDDQGTCIGYALGGAATQLRMQYTIQDW